MFKVVNGIVDVEMFKKVFIKFFLVFFIEVYIKVLIKFFLVFVFGIDGCNGSFVLFVFFFVVLSLVK